MLDTVLIYKVNMSKNFDPATQNLIGVINWPRTKVNLTLIFSPLAQKSIGVFYYEV
jgi:hypothetical protein